MSYILDALKKSQSEQAEGGVSLRIEPDRSKRTIPRWLSIGFGLVLASNAGLLLWIFVLNDQGETTPVAGPYVASPPISRTEPATSDQPNTTLPRTNPLREPVQPAARISPQPAVAANKVKLSELPADEQSLYNSFTYSTHIYTDDPSLCAIVVNGQRLMAGDRFEGLLVVAITESGIVFEQHYNGQSLQVEVSVLEQWAN